MGERRRWSATVQMTLDYLWSHRHAWVSVGELSMALGVSAPTVKRAVAWLRRAGVRIESSWEGYHLADLPRGTLVACPRCGRALGRPHAGIAGRWVCRACGYVDEAEPQTWAPLVVLPQGRGCRYCGGPITHRDPRRIYCSIACATADTARRRRRGGQR
jgi:biotin operon repressor